MIDEISKDQVLIDDIRYRPDIDWWNKQRPSIDRWYKIIDLILIDEISKDPVLIDEIMHRPNIDQALWKALRRNKYYYY